MYNNYLKIVVGGFPGFISSRCGFSSGKYDLSNGE